MKTNHIPRHSLRQRDAFLLIPMVFTAVCSSAFIFPAYAQNDFESIDEVATSMVLPPAFLRSANYEINPISQASDNFYRFKVTTDHGVYEIASLTMLRIRLHEISTIIQLAAKLNRSDVTFDRSPGGRRGVASEYVADILSDPIRTASQLLGNIQYNLEETFVEPTGDESPRTRRASSTDFNPGPHKRSAAAQLRVDVYSSNPALQRLLEAAAESRSAGEFGDSISPLLRNTHAEIAFGSGVFDMRMVSLLKNKSSEDLNAVVNDKLKRIGIPAAVRIAFVIQPAFTPRTRLYFTAYLELLRDLDNVDWLVSAAISAQTEVDALAYVNYLRMLAFYQLNAGNLSQVVTEARFPTLATTERNAVLALPLDYLAWTAPVAAATDALIEVREAQELDQFIILLAGSPTDRAANELATRAVEIRSRYSF